MSRLDPEADVGETAPLLAADRHDDPVSSRPRFRASRWQAKSPQTIVFLTATIKFFVVSTGMLLLVPLYRLIEDSLCHVYYEDDSRDLIEEKLCKVDDVQSNLAFLLGWLGLLNSVMTLIVAFPYGMLADRIGRKPVALMSYLGIAISFASTPVMIGGLQQQIRHNHYLLMIGSLFQLFGGGVPVLLATLYAIAADVSEEKDKAASFLYLTFGATAGGLVGPLLAGTLMKWYGPWVPIFVVLCVTPWVFLIFIFIPETLPMDTENVRSKDKLTLKVLRNQLSTGLRDLIHSLGMIKNGNILLVLVTFLFQNARVAAYTSILVQYISKHFGWQLADTSLLLSPLGVLNLIVLVALPKISQILISPRFGFTIFGKDLFLTRVSTFIIIIGATIEGFSHDIVPFLIGLFVGTFGAADSPLARATISHYVAPEYTSRLYALIGMVEVLGSFIGGPVLAWCFGTGLKKKGLWTGLPWFYIGFLCVLALIALLFVRRPKTDTQDPDEDHELARDDAAEAE